MSLAIAAAEPATLKLSEIILDPELLLRPLDEATAQEYADALRRKAQLPPLRVMRLPDGSHVCIDGQHRHRAHSILKRDSAPVIITEGTRADAILASASSNDEHGKPRTTEDKERSVRAVYALSLEAFSSARAIAEQCRVSVTFASNVIKTVHGGQLPPSKGKDGKIRKAPKKAKRKAFDSAKQVKALARVIDQLAKKWPSDTAPDALVDLLLTRAAELEKRKQPAAAE